MKTAKTVLNKIMLSAALLLSAGLSHTAHAGVLYGAKFANDCVNPYATDVFTLQFVAGESASVSVIGDGDSDLDLYIYDANGYLVAYDDDYTDNCFVTWTPKWTGMFKIEIKNRGGRLNCYHLRTN